MTLDDLWSLAEKIGEISVHRMIVTKDYNVTIKIAHGLTTVSFSGRAPAIIVAMENALKEAQKFNPVHILSTSSLQITLD